MAVHSSAKDFKKKSAYTDLTLPSGLTCAARRVGLEVFIKSGNVPNSLLPMMKGALKGKKTAVPTLDDIDEEMIVSAMLLFDLATIEAVRIPEVHPVPSINEEGFRCNPDGTDWVRDDELLYVDEIDVVDKQFIFQWAIGGVTDVATFRSGSEAVLADILASQDVGDTPKRVVEPAG